MAMVKKWKDFVEGKLYILSQTASVSGLKACFPSEMVKENDFSIPVYGAKHTRELLRIRARFLAACEKYTVSVNRISFVSQYAYPLIEQAKADAEAEISEYINKEIIPNIGALKADYEARVDENIGIFGLKGEDAEKVRKSMMSKWSSYGPSAHLQVLKLKFPKVEQGDDAELVASHNQFCENVFAELVGNRLARLAKVSMKVEQSLSTSATVHGATINSAKLAYCQLVDEVMDMGLPAMTEVLNAFKTIMVDRADDLGANIGVAYMHFFNANMYNTSVQFGCADSLAFMAEELGGHDALVEAAESLPLKDLMVTLAGGEQ